MSGPEITKTFDSSIKAADICGIAPTRAYLLDQTSGGPSMQDKAELKLDHALYLNV